jgi:hypothetical protein
MKHFTIAVLGREVLSFIWGSAGANEEFVSNLGGDFSIAVDEADDEIEVRKPRIGF